MPLSENSGRNYFPPRAMNTFFNFRIISLVHRRIASIGWESGHLTLYLAAQQLFSISSHLAFKIPVHDIQTRTAAMD